MERITIANRPTNLPPTAAIHEFEHEGVKGRVIMQLGSPVNDHLLFTAQAYEMQADGSFVMAPTGYPSRTR